VLRRAVAATLVLAAALAGCSDAGSNDATSDDDLTSLSARQRKLAFEGVVYVDRGASDHAILEAVRAQTKTAFGPILNGGIAVQNRELADVDPTTFVRRDVKVRNPNDTQDVGEPKVEVRYTYRDNALVPVAMSRRSALSSAVLGPGADKNKDAITVACTKNDEEARQDVREGFLWYDFDPTRASCRRAITDEQKAIDADAALLGKDEVPRAALTRSYVPVTMALTYAKTATGATYPEYDKLFTGGVKPGRLVVSLLDGRLDHKHVEADQDDGYYEWMDTLGVLFEAFPDLRLTKIEGDEDVSSVTVNGKRIDGLSFKDFVKWTVYDTGYPPGLTADEQKELRAKVGKKLDTRWVTFERWVKVAIDDAPPRDFVIELDTIFGIDEDPTPHRRAVRESDVVVYNGHSYIGYGPLDPRNFRDTKFPSTYQLFFFDSCVSYNYYEEDFFTLKPGGSKALDIITNGIEAPEYRSGESEANLIVKLVDGSAPSYQTLLRSAKATDSLRVVDGEADNTFSPRKTRVRVTAP
jgi:hypothetical protein